MGVDSGGNVWVVDEGTAHVAKFNSAGVFQSAEFWLWRGRTEQTAAISIAP